MAILGGVDDPGRCAQCGGPLPPPAPTGRPRRYCSGACRSLASYHRRRVPAVAWTAEDGARAEADLAAFLATLA